MKIVHINTTVGKGGAALLMRTLSENLYKEHNTSSNFIVGFSSMEEEMFFSINKQIKHFLGYRKISRILSERFIQYRFFPQESKAIISEIERVKPEIIHLHNIHGGYFQTNLIKKLCKIAPVVWTFHDMFPITGHCAHAFECKKWITGCGKCPHLEIYPALKKDWTAFLWKHKNRIFNSTDLTIVTPSSWLKNCVRQSFLQNKDVRLIYNGIDTKIFAPVDKQEARNRLGLPCDKLIMLFNADGGISNPFKGGRYILDVFKHLSSRSDVLFIDIGGENKKQSSNWISYGYVEKLEELVLLYSAADMLLFPTLADNCPLTVIEAMSCGLPLVTFNTGGVPELVEHMKTGYIAKYNDSNDLLYGLKMLLDDENLRRNFGEAGEKRVQELFDAKIMAKNYYDLYLEILNKKQ